MSLRTQVRPEQKATLIREKQLRRQLFFSIAILMLFVAVCAANLNSYSPFNRSPANHKIAEEPQFKNMTVELLKLHDELRTLKNEKKSLEDRINVQRRIIEQYEDRDLQGAVIQSPGDRTFSMMNK